MGRGQGSGIGSQGTETIIHGTQHRTAFAPRHLPIKSLISPTYSLLTTQKVSLFPSTNRLFMTQEEPSEVTTSSAAGEPAREPPSMVLLPLGLTGLIGVFNLFWAVIVYGFVKQRWGDTLKFAVSESMFALILMVAVASGQKVSYWLAMVYILFYAYRDWERANECHTKGHIFTQDVEYIYSAVNAAMLITLLVTLLLPPVLRWYFPKKGSGIGGIV